MDLIKWINLFKVREKTKFTLRVYLIIVVILSVVWFLNQLPFPSNINTILEFIRNVFSSNREGIFVPETVIVVIFALIAIWILGVVIPIFLYICQEITSWITKIDCLKTKIIHIDDYLNRLLYQGKVEKTGSKGFRITSSDSGVLIKNHYWKNFSASFKFKFDNLKKSIEKDFIILKKTGDIYKDIVHRPKNNFFGFIFRAQDLDNYFMISLGVKDEVNYQTPPTKDDKLNYKRKLLLTPHIRVNGKWDIFSSERYSIYLKENKSYDMDIEIRDNKVTVRFIKIKVKDFIWILPTNFRANWPAEKAEFGGEKYVFGDESIIPFRNSYGKIGFRAYGDENVYIENLEVTQI